MPSTDIAPTQPKGWLSADPAGLAQRTIRAWELFTAVVNTVDLAGPTRSAHRPARDMVIGLGTWPDSRGIPELVADAHAGTTVAEPLKATSQRLAASHRDASDDEVRSSVAKSLAQTRDWLVSGELTETGLLATASPLGPLPMGTVVHAAVYQLAITARDLLPAGAAPQQELDELGLVALLDATGAVAARTGLVASAAAVGRRVAVAIAVIDGGWTCTLGDNESGPAVFAPEELLLDLAGGRADFAAISRDIRFRDARGLLALSPVVDAIPELPGGPMLRRTATFARLLGGRR